MKKLQNIITKLLISFALISIGFALGKNSINHSDSSATAPNDEKFKDYIAVYYMHSTFRCSTCNTIEKMTQTLLNDCYSQELADRAIKWQDINFQENETLAKQFGIIASCVVVAQYKTGAVVKFQRLDKVWTLMNKPKLFNQYISEAIAIYLKESGGDK